MTNLQLAKFLADAMWRLACMTIWAINGKTSKVRECEEWFRELVDSLNELEDE